MKTVFGINKFSCESAHVGGQFFQTKARWTPFLPYFQEVCPDFLGFAKVFTDFAQISADFANFQEFCPDFLHTPASLHQ